MYDDPRKPWERILFNMWPALLLALAIVAVLTALTVHAFAQNQSQRGLAPWTTSTAVPLGATIHSVTPTPNAAAIFDSLCEVAAP